MNEQNDSQSIDPVQSSKSVWITIGILLVIAIIIGGGIYAWKQSAVQSTEQPVQKQIVSLQNEAEQQQNVAEQLNQEESNQNQQVTQPQNIVYTNSTYGFTFTFPQTWREYTTDDRILDWGLFGTSNSIDFSLSDQDSLFNVSVYTKSQWQKIQSEGGPAPTYLGENDQYVFGYATAQYAANDTMVARMEEVQDIVKTFELKL